MEKGEIGFAAEDNFPSIEEVKNRIREAIY